MTKEYLENILTEYGVAFTDSLADRLLKEFEPCVSRRAFKQIMWERDVAIRQLEELGYEFGAKIEPCDNAVSRQAAIEAFQIFREYESNRSNKEWVDRIETVLNQLPPVNQQPNKNKEENK